MKRRAILVAGYWGLTLGLFVAGLAVLAWYTPTEATMGPIQKLFYLHLPVAVNTFVACLVVFIAGVGYLWQRRPEWDALGAAAAKVAVLLCSVVLLTGVCWARAAWGQWWTWSPRLTFSLVLWLLYVVYLVIRSSVESPQRRAVVSAVYGAIAFVDVPLVYLSVRLMPDIHPVSIQLIGPMRLTLLFWFAPITLLTAGLIAARYRLEQLSAPRCGPPIQPRSVAAAGRPGVIV